MSIPNKWEALMLLVVSSGWIFVALSLLNWPKKTLLYYLIALAIFCATLPLSYFLFKEKKIEVSDV